MSTEILPIINQSYEFYKAIACLNEKMIKRWRYTLGVRIENTVLTMLEELFNAQFAPKTHKLTYLIKATSKLELLRLQLRLLLELAIVNETSIFQQQEKLIEIGRMLGGWRKACQSV